MILRRHQLPGKTRSCKTTQVLIVTWGHRTWQWDWVTDPLSGFKNFASLFSRNYLPPTPCLSPIQEKTSKMIKKLTCNNQTSDFQDYLNHQKKLISFSIWSFYQQSLLDITDPFEYLFLYRDIRNCSTFHSMDCF